MRHATRSGARWRSRSRCRVSSATPSSPWRVAFVDALHLVAAVAAILAAVTAVLAAAALWNVPARSEPADEATTGAAAIATD